MYLRMIRAIYGCIESEVLWYNLYTSAIKVLGFNINQYNIFVANNMIDGKKCTLVLYMDDNKLSHVDPNAVENILNIP